VLTLVFVRERGADLQRAGLQSIIVLLTGVAILSVGHGLHGSLVGVRSSAEGFNATTTGIIMSGYYLGLLISSMVTPGIIRSVGHIRVFAAFASVVSSAVLLMPLWVDPVWWFLMRLVSGLCMSGLFIVCESWLNSVSGNTTRGRLLSLYMIVSYGANGLGQLFLNVSDNSGFSRFILVSALLSLALVPLTLVPTESPSLAGARPVGIMQIYRASPLAVIGSFANGLGQSAFFSMGAVFGLMQGMPLSYVSLMMALPPIGVIVSQYPAGLLSDKYDRRTVIMVMSALSVIIAALCILAGQVSAFLLIAGITVFGTLALPIYSLVLAHANDHISSDQVLGASAKLILLYGVGAMVGPFAAGQFMDAAGSNGFLFFLAAVYGAIAGFAFWRRLQKPEDIKAKADETIMAGPNTTAVAAQTALKPDTV
jgi:MFS family permease